jgi:hypothetical protein
MTPEQNMFRVIVPPVKHKDRNASPAVLYNKKGPFLPIK